jgi:hypothetical protein
MTVTTTSPFRILSGPLPVTTIRASSAEDAIAAFRSGRRLPADSAELRAYAVSELETKRPKASRGHRAR